MVGRYTRGKPDMKTLPMKSRTTEQYDSAVDNEYAPTMYVVFNDAAAYPDYIIKFSLI